MAISTNGTVLTRLAGALYNTQMSNATYKEVAALDPSSLANTLYARDFSSVSDATVATTLVTNLGLSSVAGLNNWVAAQLTAAGANKGAKVVELLNGFAQLTADATYGAAATAFNTKVDAALALSQTADNTGGTFAAISSAIAGKTFTLTTGSDTFTGTSSDDTFDAYSPDDVLNTLSSADAINGGAGNDSLSIYVGTANSNIQPTITAVESISITSDATATLNLTASSGYSSLQNANSSAAVTFSNINSTAAALVVADQGSSATEFGFKAATVVGAADSVSLELNNVVSAPVTIASVETINIKSLGADNSATLTTTSATQYNISGDQKLTLSSLGSTVSTIDASAMTAALSVTLTSTAKGSTVTGGSGNDSITGAQAVNDSISAGAGNDLVKFTANLDTSDTLNGGDGTDTLEATSTLMTGYVKPTTVTISNFETLKVTDALAANLTTANVQVGISTVTLATGTDGTARTVTLEAGSKTVNLTASLGNALTINDTGSATDDTLAIKNNATTADDMGDGNNLVINGFETVTITSTNYGATESQDFGSITLTGDADTPSTLNFTGTNKVTTGAITAEKIDASGLTAAASGSTFVMGSAAVKVFANVSITGSAGNDTLRGDADDGTIINGGEGRDSIVAGNGNDTIDGGAGNDSITSGDGNDSIAGGTGNDTITLGAYLATGDSIDGGDGTDTLSITNTSLTTLNGYSIGAVVALNEKISNVERLIISDDLDQGTTDVARLDSINYVTVTDWSGAETLTGLQSGGTVVIHAVDATGNAYTRSTNDLTIALGDDSGSADSLTLSLVGQATTSDQAGDVTIDNIESLTITTSEATASATVQAIVFDLTATSDLTNLTITGTETLDLDAVAINATTINASGVTAGTGAVAILGGTRSQTITGTAQADTINGGAGADTISGGSGNDGLTGGSGADSIIAGAGVDAVSGGAGNDTIDLTETVAAIDTVTLDYSNVGADVDSIISFKTGTGGDVIAFSLTALKTGGTSGVHAHATDFIEIHDANSASTLATQTITGATVAADGKNVFIMAGTTFSSTDEVETALEASGDFELSLAAAVAGIAQYDAFLVVYTDGTDTYVASAVINTDPGSDQTFASGYLTVGNLAKLVGVSSIAATGTATFVDGNFSF